LFQLGYVHNEGADIFWEAGGQGPAMLLIMGLSFTHDMWYRIRPALEQRFRVIVFDNRGMGRSSVPDGPYSIAQMARDARSVLRAAGEDSAHVVGASMGGMIAQELALLFPDCVRSLVLGCTAARGFLRHLPEFRFLPNLNCWTSKDRGHRERAVVPMLYASGTEQARIQEDIQKRLGCGWSGQAFLRQFAAILRWSSLRRLSKLRVPTLVVHGDEDRLIPPANGRVLASRIPGAEFQMIRGAGHVLTTDQPDACIELCTDFVLRQEHAAGAEIFSEPLAYEAV
jgi:3-oxoadipate enol-lactonase